MDLSLLAAETTQGVVMQVYHPKTGKPVEGMTVTVRSFQHEIVQAVVKKQQVRSSLKVGRDGKPLEKTEAEIERDALELYESLIESWTDFQLDGSELACNAENVKRIVTDEAKRFDWLLRDILSFAADQSNYFRADDAGDDVAKNARMAAHKAGKAAHDAG